MADQRLNLTREQLASFLKNFDQIKQFERLFSVVDQVQPSPNTQSTEINSGNAQANAEEALSAIARISRLLDLLAKAPSNDDLARLERITQALNMLNTAPLPQAHNSLSVDYIDLPEVGPHITRQRRIQWNRDDGTLDVGLYNDVVLQCGQELHFYAKNDSGADVADGTPVMFTGTVGASGKLQFGLADASGAIPGEYLMGVTTQAIKNNDYGYVTAFGLVRGINTTGTPYGEVWSDGDLLYIDHTTPGDWTKTAPSAPALHFPVAVVIHAAAGSGSIFVRFKTGESLGSLSDVYINAPSLNSVIQYDIVLGRWYNTATPKFGTSTNYTEFESDGTMKASGNATCFRDELNDLIKSALNNPSSRIVQDFTESALIYKTNATTSDYAISNIQLNHDWKAGSAINPHIHWWQTENNTPNLMIQYRWQKNGSAKTTAWSSLPWAANAFTWTAGTLNQITGFGSISAPVGYGISDILQIRFMRDSTNASGLFAGADPFTTDVSTTSADVHIEVDMLGSHQEYIK